MIKQLTWKDISIGLFMKMELIKSIESSKVHKYIEIVGLLYGIKDPRELTMEEYGKYVVAMAALRVLPPTAKTMTTETTVNGKKFTRVIDINKLTGGQFIDFSVMREANKTNELLAILYDNPDMDFRQKCNWIKEHETVENAIPYINFFMVSMKELQKRTHQFSVATKTKTKRPRFPSP